MINVQIGRIIKNGTSLAIVIPINILRALKIERGDQIAFAVAEGDITCMRKITDLEKFNIKPKNIKIE